MVIVLSILGLIAGLIIVFFVAAIFIKPDYAIERSISIGRPVNTVYDYIKYLKNQDHYSKWVLMDPNMKKEYFGIDATVGFRTAWDSKDKNVGKGEQEITALSLNNSVKTRIHFIKPFEGFADAEMTTTETGANETLVKWGFTSKMKYPMNAMLLFINMEKMIGSDLETGLDNLKVILEK